MKAVLPQNPLSSLRAPIDSEASNLERGIFRLDGVSTKKIGSEVVLTFTSGLFSRAERLRPGARNTLTALAKKLDSRSDDMSIQILGFTDDLLPSSVKTMTMRHWPFVEQSSWQNI